jgi:hypothetical protein
LKALQPYKKKEVKNMKKKISIVLGGLLAVAILFGATSITTAYAQDETPATPVAGQAVDRHGHGDHGKRGMGEAELAAAAKVLGMTSEEISAALAEGKTLEDLATSAKVNIEDVRTALSALHAEEMKTNIAAAVADGSMVQEKADWLLEGLKKGFLDGGHGFGLDSPRSGKGVQPTQTAQ